MIEVRALGATTLHVPPSRVAAPLGMKALALLVYLADNAPRPVTRDALAELLWERVPPAQGRGSLRQEIRRIKKTLGDETFNKAFTVSDNQIGLVDGAFSYDAGEMESAAAADAAEGLARVLALYGGDFLGDNASRADSFQHWATERREYFKDTAVAALSRLGVLDLEAGRTDRAQRAADRIIAIDPLHEPGHEILIRCHLANGRRGQARAHFERFRALMLRELAIEPMREIAALVAPGAAPAARKPAAAGGEDGARPMIAVLNVSSPMAKEHAYLAGGVVDQIVANLLKTAWIRVASLSPGLFSQSGSGVEIGQRDLRDYADYVLRVDVRVAADRIAIAAMLTRVADGAAIFSDTMEDEFAELLTLQRRVALRIASVFEPLVLDDQARREAAVNWSETEDLNHWRLLMRARWLFWTTTRENNLEARRILIRALKTDPRNVPTHCILAFSHMLDAWSDWTADIDGAVGEARNWAEKAVQIAPNDGWAQFALGVACSAPETLEQARDRLLHALRLAPSLVAATGELARVLVCLDETAEARRLADEALALSPYDQHAGLWLRTKALAHWLEGDLASALDLIDFALIVRPGWPQNHYLRAAILAEMGDDPAARTALGRGVELMGSYSDAALRIGHPFRDRAHYARLVRALNRAGGGFAG
ncbi:BTAD domain-containing putative transcriptional regulator [Pikeienuella sp. HZG-20]|uniref:BTAD domain-containing putative transcriptional regulator n=1 Tax=Paludibacillus litoralis TaxID=3133267 RepID=UPI0030ED301D